MFLVPLSFLKRGYQWTQSDELTERGFWNGPWRLPRVLSLLSHMGRVGIVWGKHCRVKKSPEQKRRLISVLGGTSVCCESYSRHNCLSSTCSWVREREWTKISNLSCFPAMRSPAPTAPHKGKLQQQMSGYTEQVLDLEPISGKKQHTFSLPHHTFFNIGTKMPTSLLGVLMRTGFQCWGFTIYKVRF